MPTYEYECKKCGHRFEAFQRISDQPLKSCLADLCPQPKGRRGRVKRLISSGGGLLFKGAGFYSTDYRSEGYQKAAKAERESSASGSAKTEAASASDKSESKSSAKKKD
jgi:putative FmdB family regulatory protein